MENGEVANGVEQANGAVKADKESETEKACLIEPEAEVECFKKDFFEGIIRILWLIYVVHHSLSSVNSHENTDGVNLGFRVDRISWRTAEQ